MELNLKKQLHQEEGHPQNHHICSNLAEILIELSPGEDRKIMAKEIAKEWRAMIGDIPGIKDLTVSTDLFSPGEDILPTVWIIKNLKIW